MIPPPVCWPEAGRQARTILPEAPGDLRRLRRRHTGGGVIPPPAGDGASRMTTLFKDTCWLSAVGAGGAARSSQALIRPGPAIWRGLRQGVG